MSRNYKIHIYFIICSLCFFSVYYVFVDISNSSSVISMGLFFSMASFISLVINKVKYLKDRNWASFEILFFVIYWALHFLSALAWLCGYPLETVDYVNHSSSLLSVENLSKIVFLSTLGSFAFVMAFLMFCHPGAALPQQMPNDTEARISRDIQFRQLFTIQTYGLIISLAALLLMLIAAGNEFLHSAYQGDSESYVARVAETVFYPFFRIGFVACCISVLIDNITVSRIISMLYYASVMLFILILGDRGGVALVGASGLVLFGLLRYAVKAWQLVVAFLLIGALFSFAGMARQSDERTLKSFAQRGLEEHASNNGAERPMFGAMQEYSHTALPALLMAVEEFPRQKPFFNGYFSMKGLVSIIPFHAKFFPSFGEETRYAGSAEYITWLFFGDSQWIINGMGTTIVAEAFVDGGPVGVFCALFLVGALGGFFYKNAKYKSLSADDVVLYSIYTSSFVLATRAGGAGTLTRGVLWPMCIYYLLRVFGHSVKRRDKGEGSALFRRVSRVGRQAAQPYSRDLRKTTALVSDQGATLQFRTSTGPFSH